MRTSDHLKHLNFFIYLFEGQFEKNLNLICLLINAPGFNACIRSYTQETCRTRDSENSVLRVECCNSSWRSMSSPDNSANQADPKGSADPEGPKKVQDDEAVAQEGYKVSSVEIGRGPRAVIYKANNKDNHMMACKLTKLSDIRGESRERYHVSLKFLKQLMSHEGHVNVLATIAMFETPEKIFVFMPLMKGDLVQKMAQSGSLSERDSVKIARDVGSGLKYLHEQGLAHERIKPGHVLFDENNVVKIGGLGWLLQFKDPVTQELKMNKGSAIEYQPFYAPEVMSGDPYDPSLADVWSLGCLIVIMMSKKWPFQRKANCSLFRVDIEWQITLQTAGVTPSPGLNRLLSRCFEVEPGKRIRVTDLTSALDAIISKA